jgi:hypothetical protein
MTPEGRTKARIKRLLASRGVWFYMPVQGGFGATELDFICAARRGAVWEVFFIEAKRAGESPTERQWTIIRRHHEAGRTVFVCDDEHDAVTPKHDSIETIRKWLDSLNES